MRRARSSYALAGATNGSSAPSSILDVTAYKLNRNLIPSMAANHVLTSSTWPLPVLSNSSSRSSTPRASWPSSPTSALTESRNPRRNPWPTSPHSPPSESRSATPLAPQPFRPFVAPPRTPQTPFPALPPSPVNSEYQNAFQTSSRNREMPGPVELSQAVLTTSLVSELKLYFPSLLSKQGWDGATASMCYLWALKNPRTALLLYITGNLAHWPLAAIFDPLTDDMIPFKAHEVDRALGHSAAEAVIQMQRRVCVASLVEGRHVEVRDWEEVPLRTLGVIHRSEPRSNKVVEKVRWVLDKEERVLVCKTVPFSQVSDRVAIEKGLEGFRKLEHSGIARVTASYVQQSSVGVLLSPIASCDLAEYLRLPQNAIQIHLLRKWIKELVRTVGYLHTNNVRHQDIRPQKILVSGDSVIFGAFGFSQEVAREELAEGRASRLRGDRYIFAAPEKINRNKNLRAADIFSLGCVLAELMTAMKQQTTEQFQTFRTTDGDASFAANLPKVLTWMEGLAELQSGSSAEEMAEDAKAISFIRLMLQLEPAKRPKTGVLVASFDAIWRSSEPQPKPQSDFFW